jgi:GT2 family glycosyltransferase
VDFFFLQSCLFAQGQGIAGYEFIYVVNSPELIEPLQRQARISQLAYGLSQTLVMLPGNAGFGAANNIAAQHASSDRLLCLNPDVFPRDRDWARRHTDCVASLPVGQTRLFGTSLFYDDGSLMHGGMYFERDTGTLVRSDGILQRHMLRVEHHGKGVPPWASQFVASRKVSAVTGAFISVDRAWFESLGGFSEDYIFGHYEDADLCLKSLQAGTPVWIHDIPMWHMEGKGSTRMPSHEGGSMLNRWLFSRTWDAMVSPDLLGPNPAHRLLQAEAAVRPARRHTRPARAERG